MIGLLNYEREGKDRSHYDISIMILILTLQFVFVFVLYGFFPLFVGFAILSSRFEHFSNFLSSFQKTQHTLKNK